MQKKINELLPENAYRACDLSPLGFRTTEELNSCRRFIGQERAESAIYFGLGMEQRGYNLYLAGPPGVGKTSSIKEILSKTAKEKPVPPDWCYVYNFQNPNNPMAISLPTGKGKELKKDMEDLLESLKNDIPRAFESKEFEVEKDRITNEAQREKNSLFEELHRRAAEQGIQIQFTPTGIVTIPLVNGRPVTQEEYNSLSDGQKEDIRKRKEKVDEEVPETLKRVRKLEKEIMDRIKELEKKVALFAVRDILDSIREKYKIYPKVIDYLDMVQKHILENIENFMADKTGEAPPFPFRMPQQKPTFTEYQVNVFIDNSTTEGVPVVFETHPTYTNLFGSIEREVRFGALFTDFTMITAGSIAKANGGYLVVEVMDVLKYPFVWDALKKVLENEELRIEDVYQHYGMSTVGLRPEPIKLDVKVIMIGNPTLYHLLYAYDEDFMKLFKVKADFDTVVERTDEMLSEYARFVKTVCDKEDLRHFERSGVEAVIEHSSRIASNQDKLSVQFGAISKIIREANYWAGVDNGSNYVSRKHVEKAIDEKIYRSNMVEEKIRELIEKGIVLVDIEGKVVGQINGLAVYNLGDYAFGKPSRITCETFMGMEGVVNIERKANMSGNIHNKGVLILSGYLGTKYAHDKPLSLSATLVFEQTYEMVDGDSASTAELVAILSSLSGVPINQSLAVTGSVNQKGQVQPIGGVNEKVEGFYHVCKAKGLTGEQGVVIPHQNVRNLMLKREVIQAMRDGKFHVYPVETVDQALEILTGREAGKRGAKGKFKRGTVNYLVDKRLKELAESFRKLTQRGIKKSLQGESSEEA